MQNMNSFALRRARAGASLVAALASLVASQLALAAPASIDLPGDRAFPESLSSSSDGTLYVGNLAGGGVLRIRPKGKPESWIKPGALESGSTLGILVDEPSNTLWVCSNDLSGLGIKVPGAAPGSALLGFDLQTGAGKLNVPFPGKNNFCNDIAIGADGAAYVTNSASPQILRLPSGGKKLEVWFSDASLQAAPNGTGLDGLAFGSDANLYVDRYDAADLYRIDIKGGKAAKLTKLKPSRQLVLADAIRPLSSGRFLLIEGGGRVDTLTVQGDDASIATLKDGYVTPTGVTPVGNTAWVSEGQLDYLFDPAKRDQKPRLPFKLFAVPLPK
jgi:sugar lactone lactonase YvrE